MAAATMRSWVAPKKAREIVLYELNTLNVESQGINQGDRSTFVDLWDGPGSRSYNSVSARFNLSYLQNLGVNWLWFQPIHPQGVDDDRSIPIPVNPMKSAAPMPSKTFMKSCPLMSKTNTREAAMMEFTNFVAAADSAGLNVMLDSPFNHTAYDCELAASGVYYFNSNAVSTDEIRNREARFYSRTDAYDMRGVGVPPMLPLPRIAMISASLAIPTMSILGAMPHWCLTHLNRAITLMKPIVSIIPPATKAAPEPVMATSIS